MPTCSLPPSALSSHARHLTPCRRLGTALCLTATLALTPMVTLAASTDTASSAITLTAGQLDDVLSRFAQQAGITLTFNPTLVSDLQSSGLQGRYTVADALQRLLAGTGLIARRTDTGYVILPAGDDTGYQLNPITIEADTLSGVGPVGGYTANASRSASKTDTPLVETAHSVSVISADLIADRKATNVQDAVAYTAGVRVGESGLDPRFDQIQIRGFAATTTADFLDGLRQPNTGWLSYYGTEPYNLERIDVLKGPASVLYGQINPGGMVNRISKRPTGEDRHELELQGGSHNHWQGQFDSNGTLDQGGELQYRLVGVVRDAETEIEQVDNDTVFLAPSLRWQLGQRTHLTLLSQYQERLTSGSPRPYQDGTRLTRFWAGDEDFDKLDQRQYALGYEFEHGFNSQWSFQQNLRAGQVDTTNQYLSVAGSSDDGRTLERTSYGIYEEMASVAVDTRLVGKLATGPIDHTLLLGLDYSYIDFEVEYASGQAPAIDRLSPDYRQPVPHPHSVISDLSGRSHNSGLYLQDQLAWDRWRLSLGLRQDWVNSDQRNQLAGTASSRHDDRTSGQLGLLYRLDSGLAPYASFAQSFVPQSGSDASGRDYEPTEGQQYELGLKFQPGDGNSLYTASVYQLTQSNVLTADPANPANRIQTGEQRARGVELEAVSELASGLRLTASYSFNDLEVTRSNDGNEGKAPVNKPEQLASLWLNYDVAKGVLSGLALSGGARWTGSAYNDAANTSKNASYTLMDLGLHYTLPGALKGIRLGLNAKNLLDRQYITCSSGYCYRGEGRSVIGSVSYRW